MTLLLKNSNNISVSEKIQYDDTTRLKTYDCITIYFTMNAEIGVVSGLLPLFPNINSTIINIVYIFKQLGTRIRFL